MRTRARLLVAAVLGFTARVQVLHGPLRADQPIRGWTILSDSEPDTEVVLGAARSYGINHLQLSPHVIDELRDLRDPRRQALVSASQPRPTCTSCW